MRDSLENHSAGSQSLGFDYQFLYFVYLLLGLKQGAKIGYEVKDDIHIEKADGTVVLMQAKHTVQKKSDGSTINMSTLDNDLWKTISIWSTYAKSLPNSEIHKFRFFLVTNKSRGLNNELINCFVSFQQEGKTIQQVREIILSIKDNTKDDTIQSYINDLLLLPDDKFEALILHIEFKTNTDKIIQEIKTQLKERLFLTDDMRVGLVYDSLISNLFTDKYVTIDNKGKFEITFDDFCSKYGRCFKVAFDDKKLPVRRYTFNFPENIENKVFIKQLVDVGDVCIESSEIIDYATLWFQAFNNINDWINNSYILSTEIDDFEKNAIRIWNNEFKSKYRVIQKRISDGETIENLEHEIAPLALEILDFIRKEKLSLANTDLGVELSNGYYYLLSDEPKIGWHYDWKNRYKKP